MEKMIMEQKARTSHVLIVDDVVVNCKMLAACLKDGEMKLDEATSGDEALKRVATDPPDLILMDIKMPGIDGYEVCERLKQNQATQRIPIIFVSATEEACDKVKALEMGAVDFISKPFDRSEVRARVQAHLRIKILEDQQRQYSENLEHLVEERTSQLIASDRMVQLGTLSAGVAHEINNPTAFIRGNIQTFDRFWVVIEKALEKQHCDDGDLDERLLFIRDEVPKVIQGILKGTERIKKIVGGLKTFAHQGTSQKIPFELNAVIKESLELCHHVLKHQVKVDFEASEQTIDLIGDEQQLEQVFVNLFTNSVHAMEGKKRRQLTVSTRTTEDEVEIAITDTGHGMDPETLEQIWSPFFTTKPVGKGTGLGMSISQGIVEDHGGTIRAESTPGQGTTFYIHLPVQPNLCTSGAPV